MKGWVYVLSNESLDGLIKIGYSSKDPGSRAKELSGDTGVPTPFIVEYEMLVEDPYGCEQRAHKILDDKRVNQNRQSMPRKPKSSSKNSGTNLKDERMLKKIFLNH